MLGVHAHFKRVAGKGLREEFFFIMKKFSDRETNSLRSELPPVSFYGLSAIDQ